MSRLAGWNKCLEKHCWHASLHHNMAELNQAVTDGQVTIHAARCHVHDRVKVQDSRPPTLLPTFKLPYDYQLIIMLLTSWPSSAQIGMTPSLGFPLDAIRVITQCPLISVCEEPNQIMSHLLPTAPACALSQRGACQVLENEAGASFERLFSMKQPHVADAIAHGSKLLTRLVCTLRCTPRAALPFLDKPCILLAVRLPMFKIIVSI